MKPPRSGAAIGSLPSGRRERHQRVVGRLARRQRAHHLDELHQRHRVEEVQAADLVGTPGCRRQLGDAQRRGVRRDQAVGADMRLDLRVRLLLRPRRSRRSPRSTRSQSLRSAYDVVPVEVGERLLPIGRRHLALGHAVGEELVDPRQPLLQHAVVHFEHERLETRRGRHLRDARTHQPATQYTDCRMP